MRARDKIATDYPDKIKPWAMGGVSGCPYYYYYKNVEKMCDVFHIAFGERCTACWDQELPEGPKEPKEPKEQPEAGRPVVFIAGPITDVDAYWRAFEQAEELLILRHYIPLSPDTLPVGMQSWQYERICMAMIDSADAVLFLPGWERSRGATMEHNYCAYVGKPIAYKVDDLGVIHA